MSEFRWVTSALFGKWFPTRRQAMRDALEMGQAVPGRVRGTAATLRYFVSIESRRSIALAA